MKIKLSYTELQIESFAIRMQASKRTIDSDIKKVYNARLKLRNN